MVIDNPYISICITSYNRVDELIRCLKSIDITQNKIEIIISEDCSPKKNEIEKAVNEFKSTSIYPVNFNSNVHNLGYDKNLGKLIELSKGNYILFMSDDDYFIEGALDKILNLLETKKCSLAFSPFITTVDNEIKRVYNNNIKIDPNENNIVKYIYCSILFSGLIFERNSISNYSLERFQNLLYAQVYLFSKVLFTKGGCYFNVPLINAGGDGENAFGISDSSEKNPLLANRKSIFSNLEYHKGLIKTIRIFDEENGTNVLKGFSKEYSLRSITGLLNARKFGIRDFNQYWKYLNTLNIQLRSITFIYYYILFILGYKLSFLLFSIPRRIIFYFRENLS